MRTHALRLSIAAAEGTARRARVRPGEKPVLLEYVTGGRPQGRHQRRRRGRHRSGPASIYAARVLLDVRRAARRAGETRQPLLVADPPTALAVTAEGASCAARAVPSDGRSHEV